MGLILYQVPMVEQGDNPICWVACAAMILSYKRSASVTIASLIGTDPSFASVDDPARSWAETQTYLNSWSIACETQTSSPTSDYIEQRLESFGPLIFCHSSEGFPYDSRFPAYACSGLLPPDASHAIVLTGINTDDNTIAFKNPWGDVGIVSTDIVLEAISTLGVDPATFPLAYCR